MPKGDYKRVPDHIRDDIARLYVDEEMACTKVAAIHGVSPGFVCDVLKERGVPARGRVSAADGLNSSQRGAPTFTRVQKRVYVYWLLRWPGGGRTQIADHRLVMERHLCRPLRDDESVHHLNGVRDDNRVENLELRVKHHGPGQAVHDLHVEIESLRAELGEYRRRFGPLRSEAVAA